MVDWSRKTEAVFYDGLCGFVLLSIVLSVTLVDYQTQSELFYIQNSYNK